MSPELEKAIKAHKDYKMSPKEANLQRLSFAFGQLSLARPDLSKKEVASLVLENSHE